MDRHNAWRGGLLAFASLIWGTAFVAQSVALDHVGPCSFNAARSFVGCLVLVPVILVGNRMKGGHEPRFLGLFDRNRTLLMGGAACGVLLAGATLLQQASLLYTSAGKAGFLTSLYIVIVPVLGIFLGRRAGWKVWLAVLLAVAGAYLLSAAGSEGDTGVQIGDAMVLGCAVIYSLHILVIDRVAPKVDGIQLSWVQFFVAGCISALAALILEWESFSWGALAAAWGPLLYVGVLSSGVAYTLQIVGQKGLNPAVASLIMSMESVFAALGGWVILKQPLNPQEMAGCVLIFSGVMIAQLPSRNPETE